METSLLICKTNQKASFSSFYNDKDLHYERDKVSHEKTEDKCKRQKYTT